MRLYLSSYGLGNNPDELHKLLRGGTKTAIIFNAADHKTEEDRAESWEWEVNLLESVGLKPTELDLREYFDDSVGLMEELASIDLLWVRGGNSFNLRRALSQSGADEMIIKLLGQDKIVYGGYSAGPVILSPTLHGVELVDPPNDIPPGYNPEVIWDGLGIIPYVIVPHYQSDHPESEDVEESIEYLNEHRIPYKTLRDGQVIIIDGDKEFIAK